MNRLLIALLAPLFAFGFSATNLPAFIATERVQPMTGANLTFVLADSFTTTNGVSTIEITFNTEPTQIPRMVFGFCTASGEIFRESIGSNYPTNSNLDGYFTYKIQFADPELPENTRLLIRKQGLFGGPRRSAYGLECAGIAVIDWANNRLWLPIELDTFRFGDANGNDVFKTIKGGLCERPAMMMLSAPTE